MSFTIRRAPNELIVTFQYSPERIRAFKAMGGGRYHPRTRAGGLRTRLKSAEKWMCWRTRIG
jgi:hypothetical protein